jgi:hypothetical protein
MKFSGIDLHSNNGVVVIIPAKRCMGSLLPRAGEGLGMRGARKTSCGLGNPPHPPLPLPPAGEGEGSKARNCEGSFVKTIILDASGRRPG